MGKIHKRKVGRLRKRHPKYMSLGALKRLILEDGRIDKDEVRQIRTKIYADGVIDQDEAEFLFALNDATSDNDPAWKPLFVNAIGSYVLDDLESPGAVDAEEAQWLVEKIKADGEVDENEAALIEYIRRQAISVDPILDQI